MAEREMRFVAEAAKSGATRTDGFSPLPSDKYDIFLAATYDGMSYFPTSLTTDGTPQGIGPCLKLTKAGSSNLYYAANYFYPQSGTMALFPVALEKMYYLSSSNPTGKQWETPTTSLDTSGEVERLVIQTPADFDGSYEPFIYSLPIPVNCKNAIGTTALQFRHPMAELKFKFSSTDVAAIERIFLEKIELSGTNVRGTFVAENRETPSFFLQDGTATGANEGKTSINKRVTKPDAENVVVSNLYIVPQRTADFPRLKLYYSIKDKSGEKTLKRLSVTLKLGRNDNSLDWERGKSYTYHVTCTLKQIEISGENVLEEDWKAEFQTSACEEGWQTEIGSNAGESNWNSEIGTGAGEGDWNSETGAGASENGWNSETGASAGEDGWNSETGAGADEENWNSETGAGADEENWNSETGAGADEENWNSETGGSASEESWDEETGGNAYEESWQEDDNDPIIIGVDDD